MTDDLLFLRVIVVSASRDCQDLFRRAAAASSVPLETVEAESAAAAGRSLNGGADLVFLDSARGSDGQIAAAARASAKPPFTVLLCPHTASPSFETDALATRPSELEEAKRLVNASIRVRVPSRVLVVDDSATMRSIVRKVLAATRFPLEVIEVQKGIDAVELARGAEFDIVFLDYNMPGWSGLETIAEFKRAGRHPAFVLITSTQDEAVGGRARAHGAAFLKKPFFPADIEAILCDFYGLRALNPTRA
jgi:CheY-like chemotaxis protein